MRLRHDPDIREDQNKNDHDDHCQRNEFSKCIHSYYLFLSAQADIFDYYNIGPDQKKHLREEVSAYPGMIMDHYRIFFTPGISFSNAVIP